MLSYVKIDLLIQSTLICNYPYFDHLFLQRN